VRQVNQAKKGTGAKERTKNILAASGLLIFAVYVILYFAWTDILKMPSAQRETTLRLFKTETQMRIYAPMITLELYFRTGGFFGYAPNGECFPSQAP
jgi:hypothetical protein